MASHSVLTKDMDETIKLINSTSPNIYKRFLKQKEKLMSRLIPNIFYAVKQGPVNCGPYLNAAQVVKS